MSVTYNVNFQKSKRNFMNLTIEEEREEDGQIKTYTKTIMVGMPKKRVFSALMNMQEIVNQLEEVQTEKGKNEINREIVEELYGLTAEILSCNMAHERIKKEWVEEQLSVSELKEIFLTYSKFARGEALNPN